MQPQIEVLESRLAAVLMGELIRPREVGGNVAELDDTFVDIILDDLELDDGDDYYASFELVCEPTPSVTEGSPTVEFVRVRDTTHDHIITVKFAREAIDPDTLRVPKYSTPYELIDIQDSTIEPAPVAIPFPSSTIEPVPFPMFSAPYERIDIQDRSHAFVKAVPESVLSPSVEWFAAEPTDIITNAPRSSRVMLVLAVLLCALTALTVGLCIALFAI